MNIKKCFHFKTDIKNGFSFFTKGELVQYGYNFNQQAEQISVAMEQ